MLETVVDSAEFVCTAKKNNVLTIERNHHPQSVLLAYDVKYWRNATRTRIKLAFKTNEIVISLEQLVSECGIVPLGKIRKFRGLSWLYKLLNSLTVSRICKIPLSVPLTRVLQTFFIHLTIKIVLYWLRLTSCHYR